MSEKNNNENKGGRPTKLTPELQERICDAIRKGNYATTACRLVGISERTYYLWKEKGEKGEAPFAEFLEAVEMADAEAEANLLEILQKAAPEDWRAAETTLARRFPDRWGRKDKHEVTGVGDVQVTLVREAQGGREDDTGRLGNEGK